MLLLVLHSVDVEAKAELGDTSSEKANNLRYLILNRELLVDWDGFVDDLLKSVLNHQIVGSYQSPTSLGALSTSQVKDFNEFNSHIDDINGNRCF